MSSVVLRPPKSQCWEKYVMLLEPVKGSIVSLFSLDMDKHRTDLGFARFPGLVAL